MARAEDGRTSANRSMQALVERLTHLADQMRAEQQLLVRIAEQQIEMQPVVRRLAESATQSGMDDATRDHIRNIDLYLARLIEDRSEEHTSELQSLMRISYAVFCLKKKKRHTIYTEIKNETTD